MKVKKTQKIFYKIIVLVLIQVILLGSVCWAQESSTLSPAIQVSVNSFQLAFDEQIGKQAKKNVLDIVFDKRTDVQVIKDILRGRTFERIGNGATTVVVGDQKGDLVLKVPLLAASLRKEERDFIDNNRLLKNLDTFIKIYIPHRTANYIKQIMKLIYYKFRNMEFDINDIVLDQLNTGHKVAEEMKLSNVLKFRVIPNISKELKIKGVSKANLINGNVSRLIISEQIDAEAIFYNVIKKELKQGNTDEIFAISDGIFKANLQLWKEGAYDLDLGINILENWAVMGDKEYKLIDAGALSDDKEKAYEFFTLKVKQAKEALELMETLTIKETIKVLEMRKNVFGHNLAILRDLFPNDELAENFAIHFYENIIKYCDPEYIRDLRPSDDYIIASENKVRKKSLNEAIFPGIKIFNLEVYQQPLMQMSI